MWWLLGLWLLNEGIAHWPDSDLEAARNELIEVENEVDVLVHEVADLEALLGELLGPREHSPIHAGSDPDADDEPPCSGPPELASLLFAFLVRPSPLMFGIHSAASGWARSQECRSGIAQVRLQVLKAQGHVLAMQARLRQLHFIKDAVAANAIPPTLIHNVVARVIDAEVEHV